MAGLTLGTAMAANYPEPFVSGSTANAAIVYGTGSGVSDLDLVAANAIQGDLGADLPATGSTSFVGGDVYNLNEAKDSDHFNYGEALSGVYTSLDKEEMETFLADGTYDSGDIDEDYEQSITLGTTTLDYFDDSEYNDGTPTLGFHFQNDATVFSYEIEFDNELVMADMAETDMPLMGRTYYVLEAATETITLLDTAVKNTLVYGESVTINGMVVEIAFIDTDGVVFTVDGEDTEELATNEYEELDDGSYLVLTANRYDAKESGISKAVFSLGAGKIDLVTATEAELNDDDIDGLDVTITENGAAGFLDSITLTWTAEDDLFLTESSALSLPVFETIKLAFGGLVFPESEEITVGDGSDVLNIDMGNYELELLYYDSDLTATRLGGQNNNLTLVTAANTTEFEGNTSALDMGIQVVEDDRFLVTNIDADLGSTDTAYYEVENIDFTSISEFEVELGDVTNNADNLVFDSLDEEKDVGDVTIQLLGVNGTAAYFNFTASDTVSYDTAISEDGLLITLPTTVIITNNDQSYVISFTEMDTDKDVGEGTMFLATVKLTTDNNLHVASDNVTQQRQGESDEYIGYVSSDLATMTTIDKSNTEYEYTIDYWGEEVDGDVFVASADAEIVSEGVASVMVVKDTEVSSVATKNLIVVGGSCINSAAAALVGGAYCGPAWTTATGIGSGQFLIKSYTSGIADNDFALLVAGYAKEDTTNAATFLRTKVNLDTSATYKGTSATSATLVVE